MMNYALFILSFLCVSFLPGLCMCLALSLGISIGFKKTLYMMFGELLGVLLVILVCGYFSHFILEFKIFFAFFQFFAASFLLLSAYYLYHQDIKFQNQDLKTRDKSTLILQGFLSSASNPKAWIFMLSLLPSFLTQSHLFILAVLILSIEFLALCTYTLGGAGFRVFLQNHLKKLSSFSALCLTFLAFFMLYELYFYIQREFFN